MMGLVRSAIVGLAGLALAGLASGQVPGDEGWRVREVRVGTRDVFSGEEASDNALYRAFNAFHVPTREEVLLREVWFGPGDVVGEDQRAELERNLRGTGLFGRVDVRFEPTGAPGEADVVVDTHDRFSLVASASGSFVGGVGGWYASAGETNLLGTGNSLLVSLSGNDEGEREVSLDYTDRHLLDTWHRLDVSVGETEEGPFGTVAVTRPFKHLRDPYSWGLGAGYRESDVDYFAGGESVSEVPSEAARLWTFLERGWGPPELRRFLGLELSYDEREYGAPKGVPVAVPGDLTLASVGPLARVEQVSGYRELRRLDTLDFVQDVTLGTSGELFVGALHRDEAGAGSAVEALARARVRSAFSPGRDTYLTLDLSGTGRRHGGDTVGWNASAAVHGFRQLESRHTLALSLAYDGVSEDENLPVQLNLGEDTGLRGYPAREFAGRERYRLNLEDRYDTGLASSSFHLGLVAFYDVGWISDDGVPLPGGGPSGPGLDEPLQSVGVGLRIGSSEVLGSSVLRLDLAFPLDDFAGEDYGPSLSFAFGQVFGFFGNQSTLPSR